MLWLFMNQSALIKAWNVIKIFQTLAVSQNADFYTKSSSYRVLMQF